MENFNRFILITIILTISYRPVISSWDFAVSTKGQIIFYDNKWHQITSAAQQFDQLSAFAYDELDNILYFNDQNHSNSTIFSLKLSNDGNHIITNFVQKTQNESIQGMAFDPLERILYWTDAHNHLIYQLNLHTNDSKPTIFMKLNVTKAPHGIAVDVCRRKLYWTNDNYRNPSIERASLDGTKYETLIENIGLYMPRGIAIDQYTKRIVWVDDLEGDHFKIESAALDGTDRKELIRNMNNAPFNIAVDKKNIYWSDWHQNSIWSFPKSVNEMNAMPDQIQNFTEYPKGIIANIDLYSLQSVSSECKTALNVIIKSQQTQSSNRQQRNEAKEIINNKLFCLNNGEFDEKNSVCICSAGFKGDHCELSVCHNYCLEGTCHLTSTNLPQCECFPGYVGDRCQTDKCYGYCLNGGKCGLENGEPVCGCEVEYEGRHCEVINYKYVCSHHCNREGYTFDGVDCNDCTNLPLYTSNQLGTGQEQTNLEKLATCKNSLWNKTAIFVTIGVIVSLALFLLIIHSVRIIYKPLRPRIKKTYVVHKSVRPTPLTCRPATEQCEITIENCCNMNICDTPCFDPKTIQSEMNKKEDKKTLLNHADGDLLF